MKRALVTLLGLAVALLVGIVVLHPWGAATGIGVHPYPAGTPWEYQMWSGIIPALTILTLFGSLGGAWHLHNCHQDGCWRMGKHRIAGTPWCDRHKHLAKPVASTEELLTKIAAALDHAAADSKQANDLSADLNRQILAELRELR
jgi:hypothetical protein